MENSEQQKTLLDYDLFEIVGLDLAEEDEVQIESMIYRSAVLDMLDGDLKNSLSESQYSELEDAVVDSSKDLPSFIEKLKAKLSEFKLPFEKVFNPVLENVETEFIIDQLSLLEDTAQKIENPTERELKSSLCKTIREFIEEKSWDKVSEAFKKINVEIHQV